jgi:hypothetical protein
MFGPLHKGGVKHEDQEDIKEDCNNLQVQELLLNNVLDDSQKRARTLPALFCSSFPAITPYIATRQPSS